MQPQANERKHATQQTLAIGVVTAAAGVTGVLATGLWFVATASWAAVTAPGPANVADSLTLLLAAAALLLLVWFAVGVTLEALSVLPGAVGRATARGAERLTPALATRLVALLLGSTLASAAVPTSAAADTPGSGRAAGVVATAPDPGFAPLRATPTHSPSSAGTAPETGWAADETDQSAAPDPRFRPLRPTVRRVLAPTVLAPFGGLPTPLGVVVHRGDTLWAIAARDLGPEATDAEVATSWPRWYTANRAVIGPDPDLILPGQVLRRPGQAVGG